MNIGFLMPTMGVTGGVRRVFEIANRLVECGHKVTIYNNENNDAKWLRPMIPKYIQKRLHECFRELNKDIWLCGWPNFSDSLYDKIQGKKFFLLQHIETNWERLLIKEDWGVISFSTYADTWSARYNNRHYLVRGGINLDIFNTNIQRVIESKKYSQNSKFIIMGYPRKRAKYLVRALERIDNGRIELRFIGNPKVDDCYLSKYYNGIFYKGCEQGKFKQAYENAHLYVSLQTKRAAWNNPVTEAMACGCMVITTDIGAVQDLRAKGLFFIYNGKDEERIVDELEGRIRFCLDLEDNTVKQHLVDCHNFVKQYDWKTIFPKLKDILLNG